jgi:hypothetical protein
MTVGCNIYLIEVQVPRSSAKLAVINGQPGRRGSMIATEIANDRKLSRFVGKYGCSPFALELLALWGRHPKGRFSKDAIGYALDRKSLDIDGALRHMVAVGLVDTYEDNGVPLYSLSAKEEACQLAVQLASVGETTGGLSSN